MTERKLLIEQLRHEERMHQKSGAKALANLFASAASEVETLGEDRDSWRRVSERLESENIDLRAEHEALRVAFAKTLEVAEECSITKTKTEALVYLEKFKDSFDMGSILGEHNR